MSVQPILGIDPGAHGAIAVLDETRQLLGVKDMPTTPEANGRTATSAPLLAGVLARTHARIAFCEFIGARPTDAKVAAFAFGRARRVTEGCAGALGLPIAFLTPPKWKRVAASALGELAADAAVAASIAFQFGAPLEIVRHALADRLAGPLGAALALIEGSIKQEAHNG